MASTLFISDLHLSDNTPEIEAGLYQFLEREQDMARLFILGDFFRILDR
jgi:UDP-2,3-diacylglucosamine hydrolase